jgi:hypothetical protein
MQFHSTLALACTVVVVAYIRLFPLPSRPLEGADDMGHRSLRAIERVLVDYKTVTFKKKRAKGGGSGQVGTAAKRCEGPVEIPREYFKSQDGEDDRLMGWFNNVCDGTYIELGGLDGVRFSNTHVFNKGGLGWKGVLIELNNDNYQLSVANRPNEIANINAGVCSEPQTLHAIVGGKINNAMGGIWEFKSPEGRERYWPGITLDHPSVKEIQCDTMDAILMSNAPHTTYFDFLSLDVEGAEISVLESIDFARVGFGVMIIESGMLGYEEKGMAIRKILESKGYSFVFHASRNDWYINNNFDEIYKHLGVTRGEM